MMAAEPQAINPIDHESEANMMFRLGSLVPYLRRDSKLLPRSVVSPTGIHHRPFRV